MTDGVTVAVTDHALERFRQRVGTRVGGFDISVRDLVDRRVVFVCRHDRVSRELLVITLWEDARFGRPRVAQLHRRPEAIRSGAGRSRPAVARAARPRVA